MRHVARRDLADRRGSACDDRGQFVQQFGGLGGRYFGVGRQNKVLPAFFLRLPVLGVGARAVYHAPNRRDQRFAGYLAPSQPSGDPPMSDSSIEALDLAALLCSRVCHDLISPVGAIVNGLEVLEEEKDEETKEFALELIKKSARTASAKLQFCRIAFGAAGSAGAQIDLGDAETIARGFLEDDKTKLAWNLPRALLPKN